MRRTATFLLGVLLAGCGGNPPPPPPPTESAARIACDRLAARALQAGDTRQAASLASEAAECYSRLGEAGA